MSKLILLSGMSGAGKTTFARQYIEENPNTVSVSRDKFREFLYSYDESNVHLYYQEDWKLDKEKLVTDTIDMLIEEYLSKGLDVLVDMTNNTMERLEGYKKFNVDIELFVFAIPFSFALKNVDNRVRKVDRLTMATQFADQSVLIEEIIRDMNCPAGKLSVRQIAAEMATIYHINNFHKV